MRIIKSLEELRNLSFNSLSIGNFDGVHLGHQAIIERLRNLPPSLLITFEPHPKEVLEHSPHPLLTPKEEKLALLRKLGVKDLFILKFDTQLASMSAEKFINWLFVNVKPKVIIIGYNHRFGAGAEGDFELLVHLGAKLGFEVVRVPPVFSKLSVDPAERQVSEMAPILPVEREVRPAVESFPVSSSWIRAALTDGDVFLARKLLGRAYSLTSKVIQGKSRGRILSYPTANLAIPSNKLLPKDGVYAVWVTLLRRGTQKLKGMMSIGEKLTFGEPFSIEVHIFDFAGDLINQPLKVEFVQFIRHNIKFKSISSFRAQLKLDEEAARRVLSAG